MRTEGCGSVVEVVERLIVPEGGIGRDGIAFVLVGGHRGGNGSGGGCEHRRQERLRVGGMSEGRNNTWILGSLLVADGEQTRKAVRGIIRAVLVGLIVVRELARR